MSFDFGKECIDFIGCQSESIKSHKESVYKKEKELITYFLDEKEKEEQPKKLSKLLNIIDDCIQTEHINFIYASMILLTRLTANSDKNFQKKLTNPTLNILIEFITPKLKNINCVRYIVIILKNLYEQYPNIKVQITPIVLKYFTGEKTNLIAYGNITHNNALKIISNIINDLIKGDIIFNDEQKNKFLLVIIDLIDETQDPRNLKLIFDFVPKLSLCINKNILSSYSEKIFECLIGFFPINFNEKDIKNVKPEELVTQEELTNLLNNLLSQEIFNEYLFKEIKTEEYKNSSDLLLLFQSVIKNYSYELLSKYYDTIIGYILTTLTEDSSDTESKEFLNIQCYITYKSFLEKYDPYDEKIENTWNKLYDNIFSDDLKIMTIGKDMICPIITYDKKNKYIQKSFELFIKMISLYSFDLNKYMLLKFANSIIFFIFNKKISKENEDIYIKSLDILKQNKKLLFNMIKDNKYYNNNETIVKKTLSNTNLFIIISDILTGIITKINEIEIFNYEEKKEIFEIVFNFYLKEINLDDEIEKDLEHICLLIVELNKNIDKKEEIFYDKIKKLFLEKNKKSYYLIKQIYILTQDIQLKKIIIKDLIKNIENNKNAKDLLSELLFNEKDSNNKRDILNDINDEIEKIILEHINDETFNDFINNILNDLNLINLNKIIQKIIELLDSNNAEKNNEQLLNKLLSFINKLMDKNKENKNFENDKIEVLYNKIKQLYAKQINNKGDSSLLKCLKKLFKFCSASFRGKMINDIIISKFNNNDFKIYENIKNESYISLLINYTIKHYNNLIKEKIITDSYDDLLIAKIFNEINSMDTNNKKIMEKSLLFRVKNIPDKIKDKLLINLKKYYSSRDNNNNQFLNLLMNIYNSLPLKDQNENLDILIALNIECINKIINPIQSIFNLRKIIINVSPKEIIKLLDLINIYPLCKNIINIINDEQFNENKQVIKIEGIKLIGLLSGFIKEDNWESDDKKLIIFNLKRYFLNDKKRNVRYTTGIVLNLLSCFKPKISFINE